MASIIRHTSIDCTNHSEVGIDLGGGAAASLCDENLLSAIILGIAMTNLFNLMNRTSNEQAGKTG